MWSWVFDMYFANPGVQEKFGLGPLRFGLSDEISGNIQRKSIREYNGNFAFDFMVTLQLGDSDGVVAGSPFTSSAGDIDLKLVREPSGDDTGLTYSWSMSSSGLKGQGGSVVVSGGATNAGSFNPILTITCSSAEGGVVTQDFGITCTITETKGGRTSSIAYGIMFRSRTIFEG